MIANGYLRNDGRKGIRNVLIVTYRSSALITWHAESSSCPAIRRFTWLGFPGAIRTTMRCE